MAEYRLSPAAEQDMRGVWLHTAERWSPAQADHYINEIFDCLEGIAAHPHIGQSVDWVRPGYRRKVVGSHRVFYRIAGDGNPEIIRILHGRMDVDDKADSW